MTRKICSINLSGAKWSQSSDLFSNLAKIFVSKKINFTSTHIRLRNLLKILAKKWQKSPALRNCYKYGTLCESLPAKRSDKHTIKSLWLLCSQFRMGHAQGWKTLVFLRKSFMVLGALVYKGDRTQNYHPEKHPIYHEESHTPKKQKLRFKYEITL